MLAIPSRSCSAVLKSLQVCIVLRVVLICLKYFAMGRKCCVPNCRSGYAKNNEKVSLFGIPRENLSEYNRAIPRKDRVLTNKDHVCEKHFKLECIIRELKTECYTKFGKDAREQCDILQNMFEKMDSLYTDLSEYYVFDKQKYTLEEFFTDLKTFKDSFIEAKKDNDREREMLEKKEKARLAKEKADRERMEREATQRALVDMNPKEIQEGVMDGLLEALQTGNTFSREQKRKRVRRPASAERRPQLVRSRSRPGGN